MLYLHGGGFVSGIDRYHWRYVARLARELGVRVVLVDYPLTPTHTWKDTLPRLVDLFEQLAVDSPQGVVLMGDSAGGGLAVGLAQLVARRPGPQPTHLVASPRGSTSPAGRPAPRRPPRRTLADPEQAPPLRHLVGCRRPARGGGEPAVRRPVRSPTDPGACAGPGTCCSPRSAPSSRALVRPGQRVTYVEEPGLLHVYPLLPVPEARRAWQTVESFL